MFYTVFGVVCGGRILSKMKDGAYVVNCSRGGVVDEEAMMECIDKRGMRYAPDVFEHEPKGSVAEFADKAIMQNASIYGTHRIGLCWDSFASTFTVYSVPVAT